MTMGACGGDGDAADPVAELKAVAKKAAEQSSYKVKGTTDDHTGKSEIQGVYAPEPVRYDFTSVGPKSAENPTGRTRMVQYGDDIFVKSGELVAGKPWLKMERGNAKAPDKADSMKSSGFAVALLATSKNVAKVGEESLGKHYKGTVDIDEVAKYQGDSLTPKQRDLFVKLAKGDGTQKIDMDVWVGADGLPAKIKEYSKTSKGDTTVVMEYSGYGQQIKVQAPPADQVASFKDMMKEMGKS